MAVKVEFKLRLNEVTANFVQALNWNQRSPEEFVVVINLAIH